LRVVLVQCRNPLNIGAAARAMANFGFGHLRVVEPYDVAFRQARSAVAAEPVLAAAQECASVAEAVADCALVVGTAEGRGRSPHAPLERLEAVTAEMLEALRGGAKVAVLFGSEKKGLSNQALSRCQRVLRIPTEDAQPSMNLGQAVAVVLYELARVGNPAPLREAAALASAADRERLIALLAEMVERSDERDASGPAPEETMRRLLRRFPLTGSEAREWMGVVRRVLRKLRGETGRA
ncbi:MAG: RNA methyltransferase, partial [Acidobacteriota bacterium]